MTMGCGRSDNDTMDTPRTAAHETPAVRQRTLKVGIGQMRVIGGAPEINLDTAVGFIREASEIGISPSHSLISGCPCSTRDPPMIDTRVALIGALVLVLLPTRARSQETAFRAGFARMSITPELPDTWTDANAISRE